MRIPRRFVWTGADDNKSTHLALKKDGVYMTADVSQGLLLKFMGEGRPYFFVLCSIAAMAFLACS